MGNSPQRSPRYRSEILGNAFTRLSDADLQLWLKVTRAIHHGLKCSTAPRELGMLPTSLKARGAGLQLHALVSTLLRRHPLALHAW